MRILIVEDDPGLGALLTRVLREEGASTTLCADAASGLREAREGYDVIILDWMLPDGDGPTFCESVRKFSKQTPILMLTARGEVRDRVLGLRMGADDYLVKPFEVEELLARIDALTRRNARAARLVVGDLSIDRLERTCTLGGVTLDLTAREFDLLQRLALADGEPVSRAQLLQDVWRMAFDPGSGLLDVQVSRLREKLGKDRVETVRGIGYRLRRAP